MDRTILVLAFSLMVIFSGCAVEKKSIGASSLGLPFEQFLEQAPRFDRVEQNGGTVTLFRGDELLLTFSDKGTSTKVLRTLDIFSPNVPVEEGIRVGMSISAIVKLFPEVELSTESEEGLGEYLAPAALQKQFDSGAWNVFTLLFVASTDGRPLRVGKEDGYSTRQFRRDGIVRFISIYYWN